MGLQLLETADIATGIGLTPKPEPHMSNFHAQLIRFQFVAS